eukprot:SAG11_NODE_16283_length_552_cov_1.022075_1_plen_46_part_10
MMQRSQEKSSLESPELQAANGEDEQNPRTEKTEKAEKTEIKMSAVR